MKLKITTNMGESVEKGLMKLNDELAKRGAASKIFVSHTKQSPEEFIVEIVYAGENFVLNKIVRSELQKKLKKTDPKIKIEKV